MNDIQAQEPDQFPEAFIKFIMTLDIDMSAQADILMSPDNDDLSEAEIVRIISEKAIKTINDLHNDIMQNNILEGIDINNPLIEEFDPLAYTQVEQFSNLLGAVLRILYTKRKVSWEQVAKMCIAYTWLMISRFKDIENEDENK